MKKRNLPNIIWQRGIKIATQGGVQILRVDANLQIVDATVVGTWMYSVTVGLDAADDDCNCPYFEETGLCKHIAAVIRQLEAEGRPLEGLFGEPKLQDEAAGDSTFAQATASTSYYDQLRGRDTRSEGERFMERMNLPKVNYFTPPSTIQTVPLMLEVTLQVISYGFSWHVTTDNRFFVKLRVARRDDQKFYVVANMLDFLEDYVNNDIYRGNGSKQFQLGNDVFSANENALLEALMVSDNLDPDEFRGNQNESNKLALLNPGQIDQLTDLVAQLPHFKFVTTPEMQGLQTSNIFKLAEFTPSLKMFVATVVPNETGYTMEVLATDGVLAGADRKLVVDNVIYSAPEQTLAVIERVQNIPSQMLSEGPYAHRATVHFATEETAQLQQFLEYFAKIGPVDAPDDFVVLRGVAVFALSRDGDDLVADLSFDYGPDAVVGTHNDAQEEQARQYLRALGFVKVVKFTKSFATGEQMFNFFSTELPNMRANGRVTMTQDLADLLQTGDTLQPKIDVSEQAGLLTVNFSFDGIDEAEVDQMLEQLDVNRPFVQRPDGSIVLVDDRMLRVTEALTRIRRQGKIENGHVQVQASQALAVRAALGDDAEFDAKFKALTHDLERPETYDISGEAPVEAKLRPYQTVGVQWLEMLNAHGFGGILADEMGLGKTLQMVTFLNNHLDSERPSLIVAPASLIYNWLAEIGRFAPAIQAAVVDGSRADRVATIAAGEHNVLITSYNSARLDAELYKAANVNYLVLDEAQYVKNGTTKTNQALRKLQPRNVFALSGTPIENRADELWAIFAIVMPGLLPSKKVFNNLEPNEIALRIKPFIMRREKKVVLKDLPEKVEINLTNEMTAEQKTVYLAQLKQMQVQVRGLSGTEFVKNKIEILAGLTRLRQICDTPALYMDDYAGESGKLNQLAEIMQRAVANKQHVLIFSQFTSMLDQIADMLHEQGLDAFILKGDTKPKDRLTMVDAFNAGAKNIFLISLKAGGTGLNLTTADTVILVDLWWNPAVEDQATARAHRIGQKNQVTVYRLITQGSIEEQIYKLQEKKRNFVDQVLSGTQNKGSLTDEELRLILGIE